MGVQTVTSSIDRMAGVHPDLVKEVVKLAITRSPLDFSITEGLRTIERQRELVVREIADHEVSRHIVGQAVHLRTHRREGELRTANYRKAADVFKECAKDWA